MLNRVTNLTMTSAAQRSLQFQQSKLAELQDKASSLDKITRPSDDPSATAQALRRATVRPPRPSTAGTSTTAIAG